jgi:hypothetical protein
VTTCPSRPPGATIFAGGPARVTRRAMGPHGSLAYVSSQSGEAKAFLPDGVLRQFCVGTLYSFWRLFATKGNATLFGTHGRVIRSQRWLQFLG